MDQDLLPSTLFSSNFIFHDTPPRPEPPVSNFSKFSSRLPVLEDVEDDEPVENANRSPWTISSSAYESIRLDVHLYTDVIPAGCSLPSRNTLAGYLEIYFKCFQKMLPFIHAASFTVEGKDVERLLAMAVLGALYRFERENAYQLYFMAKGILMEKKRRGDLEVAAELLSGQSHSVSGNERGLGRIQTLVLLVYFASWSDKRILPDALSMSSQLAMLVRENGIEESDERPIDVDWLTWSAVEERRRTLLVAYVLLNLHSVAFNTPPSLLSSKIGLFLPGYAEQWNAKNAMQWQQAARQAERPFLSTLSSFFTRTEIPEDESVSSFANYILVHGILQQILLDHQSRSSLDAESIRGFETALRTWQLSWERTDESTLDPLSPKGPFGLSAAALLRLAYIRLTSNQGPCHGRLLSRIESMPSNLTRTPVCDRAVLHAAHALSIPVRIGIAFMVRIKIPIWSIEHSLGSLECALLLKDWLEMISTVGTDLRPAEKKIIGIVHGIIRETSFAPTLDGLEDNILLMSSTIIKIWTEIFKGEHVHDIDNEIYASLNALSQA